MADTYNGNPNLKSSNVTVEYTRDQVEEFIKCSKDPSYFIKTYVKIVHVDHGLIPFNLYAYQEEMIETFEANRFVIVKSSRQSGKTAGVVGYLLWYGLFNNDKFIAILANKAEQSREILSRIQTAYEYLPKWLQQGVVEWNKGSMSYENGTSYLAAATSSGSIRGRSASLVYLDEFCFVPRGLQEEFFKSTYPVLSSGKTSKLLITSTPNGFDLFYKIWTESEEGRNSYKRINVNWWDVPGRDDAWKQETIANTSEEQFRQEFNTEFMGSADTLISPDRLRALTHVTPIRHGLENSLRIYEEPKPDHIYFATVDVSRGVGHDNHAMIVFDVTEFPFKVVAAYANAWIPAEYYPEIIFNVCTSYNECPVLVEINDIGQQVADILHSDYEYENVVFTSTKGRSGQVIGGGFSASVQKGVRTTKSVKAVGCATFKTMLESDQLLINDYMLLNEISTYVKDRSSYNAQQGSHDDLVMCCVLFAWATNQQFFKETTNTDFRKRFIQEKNNLIDSDMLPFGFINDGNESEESWL